jgi:hypothetical protein
VSPITLDIVHADGRSERVAVTRPVFIGRNRTNDIVLNDTAVAGDHAQIDVDAAGWQILDLGSAAGTEVDGIRLQSYTPQPLNHGSRIQLGNTRMVVRAAAQTPAHVAAPAVAVGAVVAAAPVLPEPAPAPDDALLQGMLASRLAAPVPARQRVPTQPLEPLAPPQVEIAVQLAPAELSTDVNKTVVASVTVVNRSQFVDRVSLHVEGLPDWADIRPAVFPLRPGERADAQLTMSPPRSPESRAGRHVFEVVAQSEKRPDLRFAAPGALTVKPYSEYQLELLDPRAVTGWHAGRYVVQITNRGNQQQSFTLEGRNDESAFGFRFRPEPLSVEPGARRTSVLRAGIRAARLLGQPRTYPFTVTAMPSDQSAPPQTVDARFVQRPPVALWLLKLAAVLLLLALLLAVAAALWRWAPSAIAAIMPAETPQPSATVSPTASPPPTVTALPTVYAVLAATPIPAVTTVVVTREVQLPAPPPQIIVPTVVIDLPPAPPPAPPPTVIVQLPATPTPKGPDQTISFQQVAGVPISVRQPIRGDEYAGQDAVICMYRQSASGSSGLADQSPASGSGLTLSVAEQPDPATTGQNVTYSITVENSVAGRAIDALTIAAHLRPGLAFVAASPAACALQPDGGVLCQNPELVDGRVQLSVSASAGQSGVTGLDVALTAVVRDPGADGPATLALAAQANTAVADAQTLPNCGLEHAAFVQGRPEFAQLTQVTPVIEPPPAGPLAAPAHVLTADDGLDRQFADALAVVTFQRVVVQARVGVWFPGPADNYYVVYALDEQGRLIGSFRTDRLAAPAQYQLAVQGVERPIKQLVVQNVAGDDPGGLRSSGGVYLTALTSDYPAGP